MLKYKLLLKNEIESIYLYFPNGNEKSPGKVKIKSDGTRELVSVSDDDFGQIYAHHALSGIDVSRETGTIAWY